MPGRGWLDTTRKYRLVVIAGKDYTEKMTPLLSLLENICLAGGSLLLYVLLVAWAWRSSRPEAWAMLIVSTCIGILITLDATLVASPSWVFSLPVLILTLLFGGSVFSFPLVRHYDWFTTHYGWLGRLVYAVVISLLIPGILDSNNNGSSTYTIFGQAGESMWSAIILIEGVFWLPMLLYEGLRWYSNRRASTRADLIKNKLL